AVALVLSGDTRSDLAGKAHGQAGGVPAVFAGPLLPELSCGASSTRSARERLGCAYWATKLPAGGQQSSGVGAAEVGVVADGLVGEPSAVGARCLGTFGGVFG